MLNGRPLYDTEVDRELFLAPPELAVIARALERGNNILVHGERGSGKTTLLRQLQLSLREEGQPVAFVDATAVTEPLGLAYRIRDAFAGRPGTLRAGRSADILTILAGDPSPPPGGASRDLYDTLIGLGSNVEPTTVLIDASFSAQALYGVFGRMRDTIWQLPHQWLVAVDEGDRIDVLKPPADAFFDSDIELSRRTADDLTLILGKRTDELPIETLGQIATDARGNPRAAIRDANDALVRDPQFPGQIGERTRLIESASQLGRPHGMLMTELLDLGQASPSDETLLSRLGLTRARVNTLLQQLLDADLVVAASERSDGPGRPRKIYRPASRTSSLD